MFLATILGRGRQGSPEARKRRSHGRRCLLLETLENRTPLSAGISIGQSFPAIGAGAQTWQVQVGAPVATFSPSVGASQRDGAIIAGLHVLVAVRPSLPSGSLARSIVSVFTAGRQLTATQTTNSASDPPTPRPVGPDDPFESPDHGQDAYGSSGGPAIEFPPMPGLLDFLAVFSPTVARPVAASPEEESSFAGPLPLDESSDGALSPITNQAITGHSSANALAFVAAGRSVQLNLNVEPGNAAWMSYLAGGGSERPLTELAELTDSRLVVENTSDEPDLPASITAGEMPIGFLLKGPSVLDQTSPDGEAQIAELGPSSESALALTATLWTVSSESRTSGGDQAGISNRAAESVVAPSSAPPLTAFVIGLDNAFERSALDLRDEIAAIDERHAGPTRDGIARDRRIEWQGPMLPAGEASNLGREPESTRGVSPTDSTTARSSRPGLTRPDAPFGDRQAQENGQSESQEGRSFAIGVMPVVSAISVSIFGAGWFWRKRPAWLRAGSRTERMMRRKHG